MQTRELFFYSILQVIIIAFLSFSLHLHPFFLLRFVLGRADKSNAHHVESEGGNGHFLLKILKTHDILDQFFKNYIQIFYCKFFNSENLTKISSMS